MVQSKSFLNILERPDIWVNQRQAMTNVELAALTGFFAGEGSITISGGKWPTLYAALGNTERIWVEKFHKEFGGSFYLEAPKYAGAKFVFRWRVSGKNAMTFLRAIAPFLQGEKAEQLKIGLELQALKNATQTFVNQPYSEQLLHQMEGLRADMRNCRRAAAETNRKDAQPMRSDSPNLEVIPDTVAVW